MSLYRKLFVLGSLIVSFNASPSSNQELLEIIDRTGNQALFCSPYIMVYVNDANESIGFLIPKKSTFTNDKLLVKTGSAEEAQFGAFKFDSGNPEDCGKVVKLNDSFRLYYYKGDDRNYMKANASYEFPLFEDKIGLYATGNGKYLFSFSKKNSYQSYVLTNWNSYLKCENNTWCSLTSNINESLDVHIIPYQYKSYEKADLYGVH
ncbi:hypothetical protein [Fluviispira sanaruensis]|uniref:WG repeat-containing protein n=1 Tax=Fluviispira sanaruensis TaxID=2493639 RepID=A0A4P2VTN7_FLUSA|nr:hypothetical protein [Fluviispira sanaruensis]BBH52242.1 hypothetical protein JCM31447_06820 [Fluviispira sanaruensis]